MAQSMTLSQVRPSHPIRSLELLAKCLALPAEHTPQRFPSFPALERTALMGFTQPADLPLPIGETKVMLCRQAAFPAWADQVRTVAEAYTVQYSVADPQTSYPVSTRDAPVLPNPSYYNVGNRPTALALTPSISGNTIVTPYPIMGLDSATGPMPYVYVPNNYVVAFYVTFGLTNTNAGQVNVEYEWWDMPGQVTNAKTGVTVTANTQGGISSGVTFTGGAWVRPTNIDFSFAGAFPVGNMNIQVGVVVTNGAVTYTPSASNAGNLAVSGSPATESFLPLVYASEISNSTLPWNSTRLTAVGGLFTNVTQVLNKGGTIMAGRLNPATINPFSASKASISNLHPSEKAFLALETGLYTYCPPSTDLADFYDYTAVTTNAGLYNTGNAIPLYRLDNSSLVNVAFINPGANAGALAANISWHIEFRTTSALFQIGMSPLTLESLHQAQLALSQVGFFFDNPDHSLIITSVLRALKLYLPAVTAAVTSGLGMLQKRTKAANKKKKRRNASQPPQRVAVPKRNPQIVPATSARASGITRPKMRGGLDMYLSRKR
jgi:hypothetical protein